VIARRAQKREALSFSSAGREHRRSLAGELLKNLAQDRSQRQSLQGRLAAINDLLGGQIPMSFKQRHGSHILADRLQTGRAGARGHDRRPRAPIFADVTQHGRDSARLRHRGVVGADRTGRPAPFSPRDLVRSSA